MHTFFTNNYCICKTEKYDTDKCTRPLPIHFITNISTDYFRYWVDVIENDLIARYPETITSLLIKRRIVLEVKHFRKPAFAFIDNAIALAIFPGTNPVMYNDQVTKTQFDLKTEIALKASNLKLLTPLKSFKTTTVPRWIMSDFHHWHDDTVKKLDIVINYKRNISINDY